VSNSKSFAGASVGILLEGPRFVPAPGILRPCAAQHSGPSHWITLAGPTTRTGQTLSEKPKFAGAFPADYIFVRLPEIFFQGAG
jgi:hypothetical protein